MKTEITKAESFDLAVPESVMQFASVLKHYIKENKLSTEIQGNEYVHADGWKFAGISFGFVPVVEEPVKVSNGETAFVFFEKKKSSYGKTYEAPYRVTTIPKEVEKLKSDPRTSSSMEMLIHKYKCNCSIKSISTGNEVGRGSAICSNEEFKKVSFDEYAVSSMAQTRAIGKAYRNLLGFVMNSAGFATTPAEEMEEEHYSKPANNNEPLDASEIHEIVEGIKATKTMQTLEELWNELSHEEKKNSEILNAVKNHKKSLI